MLLIVVDNAKARLFNADSLSPQILRAISNELSFVLQDFVHTKAHKDWGWNGRIYLVNGYSRKGKHYYNLEDFSFSNGLLEKALAILDQHQVQYQVMDSRNADRNKPIKFHGKLYDYQESMVKALVEKKCTIWAVATGGGKSYSIAAAVAQLNVPTVIYVGTKDLLEQMKTNLEKTLKKKIGQVGDGICDIQKITVCTWQSAASALNIKDIYSEDRLGTKEKTIANKALVREAISTARFFVIDEAHHAACNMVQAITKASTSATWRLGASATPFRERGDDLLIEAELGYISHVISVSDLMRKGRLVSECEVTYHDVDNSKLSVDRNFHKAYSCLIVDNDERNKKICDLAVKDVKNGFHVLITVDQKEKHGEQLYSSLAKRISGVEFLHGKLTSQKRKEIIAKAIAGKCKCIIATSLADEGLDIPILSCLILAGGKKSFLKTLQRAGRILRKFKGKKKALIRDFVDDGPYVQEHSEARMHTLMSQDEFRVKCENTPRIVKMAKRIRNKIGDRTKAIR